MLIEGRRSPPAIRTTSSTGNAPAAVTLLIDNALWTCADGTWAQSDVGDVPDDWTMRAYREIGDKSLVAPATAQSVIDAGREVGIEEIDGISLIRFHAGAELMIPLLTAAFDALRTGASGQAGWSPAPPGDYLRRYDADLWVDPRTGFVLRERTITEYTEERLHGQAVGTGPATFTTTREFFHLNAELQISRPRPRK